MYIYSLYIVGSCDTTRVGRVGDVKKGPGRGARSAAAICLSAARASLSFPPPPLSELFFARASLPPRLSSLPPTGIWRPTGVGKGAAGGGFVCAAQLSYKTISSGYASLFVCVLYVALLPWAH